MYKRNVPARSRLRNRRRSYRNSRRRTIPKARRSRRRNPRYAKQTRSFTRRVLAATSRTCQITNDQAVTFTSNPGSSFIFTGAPTLTNGFHVSIQGRLNNDELADVATTKNYFLRSCVDIHTFLNASVAKVYATAYYYTVRRDTSSSIASLYNAGFINDGILTADNPATTPYQSSDFCSFCKITRVTKRVLEQGQIMRLICSQKNRPINADRYNRNVTVAGSRGVIVVFVGDLAINTAAVTQPTTAPTAILYRLQQTAMYHQMADSALNNYYVNRLPTGALAANIRTANADTGAAQTGTANSMF